MKPQSRALGQALLDHHNRMTKKHPPGEKILWTRYTIQYGKLCAKAGVPSNLVRGVGAFLSEVAQWCAGQGYPPLHSLAVNVKTGTPGPGYEKVGGFKLAEWPSDVERCIRFSDYPEMIGT